MRVQAFLSLPAEMTPFERTYLGRLNRIGLGVLWAHVPAITAFAWWNETGPLLAFLLCAFAMVGPLVAHHALEERPRFVSCVLGVALMLMAAVLVHVGQGPMQIEMHFHFFVILASLAVFGNPRVIQVASATVALHHVLCWWLFPSSVFNYDAALTVVAVHATFVSLLAVSASFIARHFFDNVIGLSRKVEARTRDLQARHRDVRLLLDHIGQGFLTLEGDGRLGVERSQILERWFGPRVAAAPRWSDFLAGLDPDFAARTAFGWEAVVDDFMPVEVTLEQMPRTFAVGAQHFAVQYRHIVGAGPNVKVLVVVDDVTDAVAAEAAARTFDAEMQLLQGILRDPAETFGFLDDAEDLLERLERHEVDAVETARALHTLKGNAGVAGFLVVARAAHEVEQRLVDAGSIGPDDLERMASPLRRMAARAKQLQGRGDRSISVEPKRLTALERAVEAEVPRADLAAQIRDLRFEEVEPRLRRLADHAARIACNLGKPPVHTYVEDGGVRLERARWAGVWSALVHVVRNAVDHGLESPEERAASGKPPVGRIWFRACSGDDVATLEVEDDGRGIDLAALARKAEAVGLPVDSPERVLEALWADGVSTATEVTEISGRGVGMAALRSSVEAAGGRVRVTTRAGAGTTVQVVLPPGAAVVRNDSEASAPGARVTKSPSVAPQRGSARPAAARASAEPA